MSLARRIDAAIGELTLFKAGLIAGSLAVLITAPVALGVSWLFGFGWGVAYAVSVSALCTWVPLQRWRRRQSRGSSPSSSSFRRSASNGGRPL